MASIQNKADKLRFKGRGPLDAKSLVPKYADLLEDTTWKVDGTLVAYNGMIVSVGLDTAENNGVYYLHDSTVTSPLGTPDVTNPANWHKLGESAAAWDPTAAGAIEIN
jgi:hypothetical protein